MATSENKPKQFAFVLTEAEMQMLEDLAGRSNSTMSKANWLRLQIRAEYLKAFPDRRPGAKVPCTFRALVADLSGPDHYTVRNIADRMNIPVRRLVHFIERVSIKTQGKVFDCVDGKGGFDATWELLVSREKALKAVEDAGFHLDEPLVFVNPDAEK